MKTNHLLAAELHKQTKLDPRIDRICSGEADLEEIVAYAFENTYAAIKELTEALDEISWKPWASAKFFNRDAFLGELADVQLFLDNLKLLAMKGGSIGEVYELSQEFDDLVLKKMDNAVKRQENGYDGIKDKCPACKRDKSAASIILGQTVCPCGHDWEEYNDQG